MRIEILYWAGCPSLAETQALLESVLAEAGVDARVELLEVTTHEQAEAERFPGSPTIRVDGRDVDPAGANGRPSLSCRIYHRPDGRATPVPTRAQLLETLA
jgi:hypothetical protein